jgi:hypothetical protein
MLSSSNGSPGRTADVAVEFFLWQAPYAIVAEFALVKDILAKVPAAAYGIEILTSFIKARRHEMGEVRMGVPTLNSASTPKPARRRGRPPKKKPRVSSPSTRCSSGFQQINEEVRTRPRQTRKPSDRWNKTTSFREAYREKDIKSDSTEILHLDKLIEVLKAH